MLNGRDVMTNRAIAELYRLEKIFKENEAAARTLYRSCLQSYQRTTDKTKPAYKEVEFHFDNPLDMTIQFITNLPKEWEKWQMQQLLFDDRDQESNYKMRPSIDRKNSNGHYEINNIQTDSIKGNYTEASNRRRKKTALIEIKNGELRFKVYESQTEIKDEFNISNTKLNSMKKQPYKLGVLKEDGAVMALGKQIIAMEYKEYPPRQKEEQIRLDKQSYIDLKERIELLEGLSFDKKRSDHIEKLKGNLALYRKFGWDKL
ncbi:hypothetical protein B0H99_103296 [Planomicrobium soli]|uniref:Uncharacterized protein n=2 Tax=Planomicrobium soli TaxID=1176648 RepID=A0A2P8H4P0_9BACL|nr:hypothetical protein B0H99_103296 [Planomicrobium soli]